jgi:hypothetical protein
MKFKIVESADEWVEYYELYVRRLGIYCLISTFVTPQDARKHALTYSKRRTYEVFRI